MERTLKIGFPPDKDIHQAELEAIDELVEVFAREGETLDRRVVVTQTKPSPLGELIIEVSGSSVQEDPSGNE